MFSLFLGFKNMNRHSQPVSLSKTNFPCLRNVVVTFGAQELLCTRYPKLEHLLWNKLRKQERWEFRVPAQR